MRTQWCVAYVLVSRKLNLRRLYSCWTQFIDQYAGAHHHIPKCVRGVCPHKSTLNIRPRQNSTIMKLCHIFEWSTIGHLLHLFNSFIQIRYTRIAHARVCKQGKLILIIGVAIINFRCNLWMKRKNRKKKKLPAICGRSDPVIRDWWINFLRD